MGVGYSRDGLRICLGEDWGCGCGRGGMSGTSAVFGAHSLCLAAGRAGAAMSEESLPVDIVEVVEDVEGGCLLVLLPGRTGRGVAGDEIPVGKAWGGRVGLLGLFHGLSPVGLRPVSLLLSTSNLFVMFFTQERLPFSASLLFCDDGVVGMRGCAVGMLMGGLSPLGMLGMARLLIGVGSGSLRPGMGREGISGAASSVGIFGVGRVGFTGRLGNLGPPGWGNLGPPGWGNLGPPCWGTLGSSLL